MSKTKTHSDYYQSQRNSLASENAPLRSENVMTIMNQPPKWLIRWGISLIYAILIGLFVGAYFIKYPAVISAKLVVESTKTSALFTSEISGGTDSLCKIEKQKDNLTNWFVSRRRPQSMNRENTLLPIVPNPMEKFIGTIFLPIHNAEKVKVGQSVNLKFIQFSYLEYGVVKAKIQNISSTPIQHDGQSVLLMNLYFPNGLLTNYGKILSFTHPMEGIAEIATADGRLFERIINPIKAMSKP